MTDRHTTLALELLINHVIHLRSQVEILQEKLHEAGLVSQDGIERDVDENWALHGEAAIDAFWDELRRLDADQS